MCMCVLVYLCMRDVRVYVSCDIAMCISLIRALEVVEIAFGLANSKFTTIIDFHWLPLVLLLPFPVVRVLVVLLQLLQLSLLLLLLPLLPRLPRTSATPDSYT